MRSIPPDDFCGPEVERSEDWIEPIVHIIQIVSRELVNHYAIIDQICQDVYKDVK